MADIAVQVAIEVLNKTSGIVGDLIVKEGSRLSRLQEEISWIEREMRHIHSYLKDFEHKQGENERVANLMRDIRDLAFDVEDTMEKYFPISLKRKGFKGFLKRITHIFSNYYGAYNFLVEVEAIKRRIEDLNRVRQTYGINEQRSDQASSVEREGWDERRSFPHVDEPNITGLEDHTRNLVAKICDDDSKLCVISITGMPGLGKTTLAKKVYNLVQTNFELSAWVYVSQLPIIKNILQDIARQVGLKIEKWEDGGEAILYGHLSQNKYIIVIDDIWQTSTWDALKIAVPTNSESGSRIILTSRYQDVGVHVGGWSSLFELQPLEESYSKQLFETSLGSVQTENDPPGLKEIGEEILHRCGGVPLAIVMVSGLLKLRVRSIDAWNGVLEQMDQGENKFSKIFALSYLDLPTNLKPCFLYFGIFPEDHKIDTFDLINLWAAEGFIKGTRVREVEDVGADYLNHLIARNLIEVVRKDPDGKVKSCRIHDILRSICIHEAKDINFFIGSTDLTQFNCEVVRRLTTHGMSLSDSISLNCRTPKLRSFLTFQEKIWNLQNMKLYWDFCKDLNLVRVLYSENYFGSTRFSKVIWSLKNLTYLKLEIGDDTKKGRTKIPEGIIILENLVTLDIKSHSGRIFIFPMVIWNMKRIRHLLLRNRILPVRCTYKGFDPNAIPFQNFQTLELPFEIFDADWLHKLSEVRTLNFNNTSREVSGSCEKIAKLILSSNLVLNKLETLKLSRSGYGNRLPVTALKIAGHLNLGYLFLNDFHIEQWPQPEELPQNLTKIVLFGCNLNEDPFVVMKKMPKLRVLKLFYCEYASGELVCTGEPGNFPQLEQLYIRGVTSEITIEDGGMPRLKEFVISEGNLRLKLPTRIYQILRQDKRNVDWM